MNKQIIAESRLFVSGRSLSEYIQMFDLSASELKLRILDCAAGAASFTAEAVAMGSLVWAIDPLYALPQNTRAKLVEVGYERATANILKDNTAYNWGFPSSPEEHRKLRRQSADIFLNHVHLNGAFYIGGKIEELPFKNEAFDIVLTSHLLFVYADLLSIDIHIRCINEMLRVATKAVRIYPIVGFGVDAEPTLRAVITECTRLGYKWSFKNVPYRFLKNAGQMLEIEKIDLSEG